MSKRANSGLATAKKMTPEQLRERAMKGVEAKKTKANLPKVQYRGEIKIGDITLPCYVLDNDERVLSGRGLQVALNLVDVNDTNASGSRLTRLFNNQGLKPFLNKELEAGHYSPIECYDGSTKINGYKAEVLADICEAVLKARQNKAIDTPRMTVIAQQCEILMRGFARVGITALVDEATGYQDARAKDDLAKIFEAFIAKELQPWVKTFPDDYYKELFRLYGLEYPPKNGKVARPQFFGNVTNKVIYKKLAPEILPELKKQAQKYSKGTKLHQGLTPDKGHPDLLKLVSSVTTIMKLSANKEEFFEKVNLIHPDFDNNYVLQFD